MAELVADPYAVPKVVSIISSLLQRVAEHNDTAVVAAARGGPQKRNATASVFQCLSKPSISVSGYLERIFRYANCSNSCYVVAYIYLDRYVRRHPSVAIDSFNVHRFIIASVLTAVKFMDDRYYNNAYFAKVGGISLMEMNYMEVGFLFGVGFELNVSPNVFTAYCSILQSHLHIDRSPAPQRLICSLSEEEYNNCQQMQQMNVNVNVNANVREVLGT